MRFIKSRDKSKFSIYQGPAECSRSENTIGDGESFTSANKSLDAKAISMNCLHSFVDNHELSERICDSGRASTLREERDKIVCSNDAKTINEQFESMLASSAFIGIGDTFFVRNRWG